MSLNDGTTLYSRDAEIDQSCAAHIYSKPFFLLIHSNNSLMYKAKAPVARSDFDLGIRKGLP